MRIERADASSQVDRASGEESRDAGEESGGTVIEGRVFGGTGEVAANVRPDVRVILTSAYSREIIEGSMRTPQICSFIRKRFELGDLLKAFQSSVS